MRRSLNAPTVLNIMITSYRVTWAAVEERVREFPDEARQVDEFSNTVLYNALSRRIDDYPPSDVVKAILRAYPEAVWMGLDVGKTPLIAACRRRASYEILSLLMNERPSVNKDRDALLAFWQSYCDVFGGEEELVEFCREALDLEASRIVVRLFHLLSYCSCRTQQLIPFRGLHTAAACSSDPAVHRYLLRAAPKEAKETDLAGDLPLHILCRNLEDKNQHDNQMVCLRELIEAFPEAVRLPGSRGDLPLHIAIKSGWSSLEIFTEVYPASMSIADGVEGFLPFQLAAVSDSPVNCIYRLLRDEPGLLHHRLINKRRTECVENFVVCEPEAAKATPVLLSAINGIDSQHNPGLWESFRAMLYRTCGVDPSYASWLSIHAVSSLPMCTVGLLEVLSMQSQEMNQIDDRGWSPLHHVASCGKKEMGLLKFDSTICDKNGDDNKLPCIARLRWLLQRIPQTCRVCDRAGQLPLHVAIQSQLPIVGLKIMYETWPEALMRRDGSNGLFPALTAATGQDASLETIYHVLLACPAVLSMRVG